MKHSYPLHDSFSATGQWWLPTTPNAALYGTLACSRTDITLETSGSFDTPDANRLLILPPPTRHEAILGTSNDGVKFTLLRTTESFSSRAVTRYRALRAIVGTHTGDLVSTMVQSASFQASNLDEFIAFRPFEGLREDEGGTFKSLTRKYVQHPPYSIRVDSIKSSLEFGAELSLKETNTRVDMRAHTAISLTPDEPRDVEWYLKHIWSSCYLLSLLADENLSPLMVRTVIVGDELDSWLLYPESRFADSNPSMPAVEFLFHLAHVADDLATIMNNWFGATEAYRDAINLTMDVHRNAYHSLRSRFLFLAQATEVASRATTGLANKYTLRKGISAVLASLSQDSRHTICQDVDKFTRGIVDTRNFLTHYSDRNRSDALKGEALFWASEKLLMLLRIMLLKYLGIDERTVVERIRKHHRLDQRIRLAANHPESVEF